MVTCHGNIQLIVPLYCLRSSFKVKLKSAKILQKKKKLFFTLKFSSAVMTNSRQARNAVKMIFS